MVPLGVLEIPRGTLCKVYVCLTPKLCTGNQCITKIYFEERGNGETWRRGPRERHAPSKDDRDHNQIMPKSKEKQSCHLLSWDPGAVSPAQCIGQKSP